MVSSIYGGEENYLTNEGIDAIVPALLNNPGRYSTMNPNEEMYGDHSPVSRKG